LPRTNHSGSDLVSVYELLAVADDEGADTPPLPEPHVRRQLRETAAVPLVHIAAAVGASGPSIYAAEGGRKMRNASAERRYRRVLSLLRIRLEERDPHAFDLVA
jgi:hypothetical protein